MALYIKGPDSGGTCCECSTRPLPCDTCTANPCDCNFHAPLYVLSSYAEAVALLATNYFANCLIFQFNGTREPATFTADNSTVNSLSVVYLVNGSHGAVDLYYSVAMAAGTLTFDFDASATTTSLGESYFSVDIYNCATFSSPVATYTGPINTKTASTTLSVAAGEYYIRVSQRGRSTPPAIGSLNFTMTNNAALVVNPVVVDWDDGGTTRELEACPKLKYPINGAWFINKTEAQNFLNESVLNCVTIFAPIDEGVYSSKTCSTSNPYTFGATVTYALTYPAPSVSPIVYCSINNLKDDVVVLSYNSTYSDNLVLPHRTFLQVKIYIYDDNGTFIEQFINSKTGTPTENPISLSGSFNWTIPYSGRFVILFMTSAFDMDFNTEGRQVTMSMNGGATSSNLTLNNVRALYDVDVDCPSYIDC